eukprot:ctg_1006.g212
MRAYKRAQSYRGAKSVAAASTAVQCCVQTWPAVLGWRPPCIRRGVGTTPRDVPQRVRIAVVGALRSPAGATRATFPRAAATAAPARSPRACGVRGCPCGR